MLSVRRLWWRIRSWCGVPSADPDTVDRVAGLVRDEVRTQYGTTSTARKPGRPRRPAVRYALMGGAVLLLGGSAAAGAWLMANDRPTMPLPPDARAGIAESPYLRGAPWLYQRAGAPHVLSAPALRSLQFPPGTTYPAAASQLVRSVIERGGIPTSARVTPALPPGVVWRNGTKKAGPRLSLVAPFGYTIPTGRVRLPSLSLPGSIPLAHARQITRALREGRTLGPGATRGLRVDTPRLAPCQQITPGRPHRACRLNAPPAKRTA